MLEFYPAPPLDPSKSIHRVPLKEEEQESWLEFKKLNEGIRPLFALTKTLAEQKKRTIEIDHPFVRVIGDFAIDAFNKTCEAHVKKGEHKNLHDFELMNCKYLKILKSYYFYMTIEAIEEGDLGVYEATIVCSSDDGRKTLSKFVVTDRKPVGKRSMVISKLSRLNSMRKIRKGNTAKAISHLSRLTSIHETVKRVEKDIMVHLQASRKSILVVFYLHSFNKWLAVGPAYRIYMYHLEGIKLDIYATLDGVLQVYGKKNNTTTAELVRLKKHYKKALRGLRKVLTRDIRALFPPSCSRTTDADGWSDPDRKTGMVRRMEGNASKGYDYYNPLKAFALSLIW